jgi:hypothetical protein
MVNGCQKSWRRSDGRLARRTHAARDWQSFVLPDRMIDKAVMRDDQGAKAEGMITLNFRGMSIVVLRDSLYSGPVVGCASILCRFGWGDEEF